MSFGISGRRLRTAEEAINQVRNVFCVGRNYRDHAVELGNDVPTQPMIFGKSTHAVVPAVGTVRLPQGRSNIHHELELVLWIKGPWHAGARLEELVGGISLGLDLTDRDAQSVLKAKGHPWEFAKGFIGSAVVSDVYAVEDWAEVQDAPFSFAIGDTVVQSGVPRDMLFSFQTLLDYVGTHFGLNTGDILFTGTPAGVGPLHRGDTLEFRLGNEVWARCRVE